MLSLCSYFASVLKEYPDIDCFFLNAGIQSIFDLGDPAGFDLDKYLTQFSLNYNSIVALAHAFLPDFIKEGDTYQHRLVCCPSCNLRAHPWRY